MNRFWQHVQRQHPSHPEVQKIEDFKDEGRNGTKMKEITKLRLRHMASYNSTHKEKILARKIKEGEKNTNLVECVHCGNYFRKRNFSVHKNNCPLKHEERPDISVRLTEILAKGYKDDSRQVILNDKLILLYGEEMVMTDQFDAKVINTIREQMRMIATVLVEMRKLDSTVSTLASIFNKGKWKIFKDSIKIVSGYNEALTLHSYQCWVYL